MTNHNIHGNVVWDGEICIYGKFNLEGPLYCEHYILSLSSKPVNDTVALTIVCIGQFKVCSVGYNCGLSA